MKKFLIVCLLILGGCSSSANSVLGPKKNTSYDYRSPCAGDCKNMKRLKNHADN